MRVKLFEEGNIVVGGPKEETVIHVALLSGQGEFSFERLECRRLRHRIGHIEIGGHPTSCCCTALRIDIGLLRQTRLTKVDMIVDDAWQYETSRSINDFIG